MHVCALTRPVRICARIENRTSIREVVANLRWRFVNALFRLQDDIFFLFFFGRPAGRKSGCTQCPLAVPWLSTTAVAAVLQSRIELAWIFPPCQATHFHFVYLVQPPSKPGQLILKRRDVYQSTRSINRENVRHRPAAVLTRPNPRDSVTRGGLAARRRGRRDDVRGLDRVVLLLLRLRQTGHVEEEHESDLRE
jgi:hypothetical protein